VAAAAVPVGDCRQPAAQAARAEAAGEAGQMPGDGIRGGRQCRLPGGRAPPGKSLPVGGIGAAGMRRLWAPGRGVVGGDGAGSPAPARSCRQPREPATAGSTTAIGLLLL
jgi:hypothetical protein